MCNSYVGSWLLDSSLYVYAHVGLYVYTHVGLCLQGSRSLFARLYFVAVAACVVIVIVVVSRDR